MVDFAAGCGDAFAGATVTGAACAGAAAAGAAAGLADGRVTGAACEIGRDGTGAGVVALGAGAAFCAGADDEVDAPTGFSGSGICAAPCFCGTATLPSFGWGQSAG